MSTVMDERLDHESIRTEIESFFEEETAIHQEINEEIIDAPFRLLNIPIREYCELTEITSMQIVPIQIDPSPPEEQLLLGIKDVVEGVRTPNNRLFLANHNLVIPHIQGITPTIRIRNFSDKLIPSGFEIIEQTGMVDNYIFTLFCYIPYMGGKKIFGFGKTHDFLWTQRLFSVGFCREDELLPSFELPSMPFRNNSSSIGDMDRIICSNTSARFRKMSANWNSIGHATEDLNTMLFSTIDPNYMEKIMRLNMFFTVPNAQING